LSEIEQSADQHAERDHVDGQDTAGQR
jgi:hypothetical protein